MLKNSQQHNDQQPIDISKVPAHIAIIMDGNGRWAKQKGLARIMGHQKGVDSVRDVVKAAGDLGVKVLTLYAFSEENWGRPGDEVNGIFSLLDTFVVAEKDELKKNNVRLQTIGDFKSLPKKSQALITETIDYLSENNGLILNIALSYGSRSEILHACKALMKKALSEGLSPEDIDQKTFENELWTARLPAPDLLIRTSGEQRISNFLLWQIAYTELWFTPVLWPDFRRQHFLEALQNYQNRERRFGLVPASQKTRPESEC